MTDESRAYWRASDGHCPNHRVNLIDRRRGYYKCSREHRHVIPVAYTTVSKDGVELDLYEHGKRTRRIEGAPQS